MDKWKREIVLVGEWHVRITRGDEVLVDESGFETQEQAESYAQHRIDMQDREEAEDGIPS